MMFMTASFIESWLVFVLGMFTSFVPSFPARRCCEAKNEVFRKEWGELTPAERIEYTDAVRCMQWQPQQLPRGEFPGVRNRFDDFVATHLNYTLHTHLTGLFLPWHRHFIWLWETALRDECGFTGQLPYWNWPIWANNLAASPLFDCSDSSLSGDGEYDAGQQNIQAGGVTLPRGTGGGCVRCGPFKDMDIHMGPFSSHLTSLTEIPAPAFDYNPRCLNRSLNNFISSHYTNETIVHRLLNSTDIVDFQTTMERWPPSSDGVLGAHGGGHFSIGATLEDSFVSPQDPAFMLHHSMVDRLWATWQAMDEHNRRFALNGTNTITNPPWGTPVTPDMMMEFGILDRPRPVGEAMDPRRHTYCYSYT
ncbi:hypothetical protein N7537_008252 [Penicillium hordei]|uniref:Tyrosinase copper-binding domain-containing protein n=1 Tax=Penicillium hordei TaxID=40994 RepID=A0AAD6E1A3_9EURO|nr:uncharacterized protein N7537_008252 [Penicillium hordei]KAJ5598168.1 hypothetical protein N7537_008252 [Penicillium hordei]